MEPKLVVMAAGLGSRFGGLKQMESVTEQNEIILDFACYDAVKAGFKDIIFVIKPEMEEIFKERVLSRMAPFVKTSYVFQTLDDLPEGYQAPEGRTKPWGTCQAVMAARDLIDGPFAVVNSDDYYGRDAFKQVYDYLKDSSDDNEYCMAGYYAENTLSDEGTVTRGVCMTDENGYLTKINETKNLGWVGEVGGDIGVLPEKEGDPILPIAKGTVVSMNFWGFKPSMMKFMIEKFPAFLDGAKASGDIKAEYLLPIEVGKLLDEKKVSVKVLEATDKWYGVTYKQDKEKVEKAFRRMKDEGKYPEMLWGRA